MSKPRARYTVLLNRDQDGAWNARIAEAPDCQTQARTIRQAKDRARAALLRYVGAAAGRAELVDRIDFPEPLRGVVEQGIRARARAEAEAVKAVAATRAAASELVAWGLSTRDAGDVLGVSHQRVSQLLER